MKDRMTPSDLYAMCMESDTADEHMGAICAALGTPYPPSVDDYTELLPVFTFKGTPAPQPLAHH